MAGSGAALRVRVAAGCIWPVLPSVNLFVFAKRCVSAGTCHLTIGLLVFSLHRISLVSKAFAIQHKESPCSLPASCVQSFQVLQPEPKKTVYAYQLQAGTMYQHNLSQSNESAVQVFAGVFYRWNDALIPALKLRVDDMGFADVNLSKLKSASAGRGGAELTVSYTGFFKNNGSLARTRCPVSFH